MRRGDVGARALNLRGAELRWLASALHSAGHRLTAAARAAPPSSSSSPCMLHAPSLASTRLYALAAAPLRAAARAALAAALDARVAGGGHQVHPRDTPGTRTVCDILLDVMLWRLLRSRRLVRFPSLPCMEVL